MKRFYRYLIYKLYSWALTKKGDTPVANVIFTLTVIHSFQMLSLYVLARHFSLFNNNYLQDVSKLLIIILFFIFVILHYFLFYDKEKWNKYVDEFKVEDEKSSKRGTIIVLLYLIGSVLLFFLLLPLLFGF